MSLVGIWIEWLDGCGWMIGGDMDRVVGWVWMDERTDGCINQSPDSVKEEE